jgi:hypothetical protein
LHNFWYVQIRQTRSESLNLSNTRQSAPPSFSKTVLGRIERNQRHRAEKKLATSSPRLNRPPVAGAAANAS